MTLQYLKSDDLKWFAESFERYGCVVEEHTKILKADSTLFLIDEVGEVFSKVQDDLITYDPLVFEIDGAPRRRLENGVTVFETPKYIRTFLLNHLRPIQSLPLRKDPESFSIANNWNYTTYIFSRYSNKTVILKPFIC